MLQSMTGYGRGEYKQDEIEVAVEVRSVNNRFLDIAIKAPNMLTSYDQQIKDIIKKYVNRGRLNVTITVKNVDKLPGLVLNLDLARRYYQMALDLQQEFSLGGEVDLATLMSFPDIFIFADEEADERCWLCLATALNTALENLQDMRQGEGGTIRDDLLRRINFIEKCTTEIETLTKGGPEQELIKLRQRIRTIASEITIDENRLETEIAIIADRLDITEECVRLHSHNKMFLEILDNGDQPGRSLNFLLQEMNREANTIGAKASQAQISHMVVKIKEEIEKIREQVQNVE